MSLLDNAMENFTMIDRTTVSDGYGGFISSWKDGAQFKATAVYDSSMQARIGGVQGVTALYTITTGKAVNLQYHDIVRRESDGKIFRVTSDGDDNKTPSTAGLNMRQVTAEEFTLNGVISNGQSASTS